MTKRKIMSIIGLSFSALMIVCLFLPFIEEYNGDMNFWDFLNAYLCDGLSIVLLITFIISIIMLILQICGVLNDTKLGIFPYGFTLIFTISVFFRAISNDFLSSLKFGYYMTFIFSILGTTALGIGGLLSNEKKTGYANYGSQPKGYDPHTGQPIYDTPKQITGYDPHTGKPIYK